MLQLLLMKTSLQINFRRVYPTEPSYSHACNVCLDMMSATALSPWHEHSDFMIGIRTWQTPEKTLREACAHETTTCYVQSRDSSVGTALGYGLDDRGSIPGVGGEFFSSPPCLERHWGPPSLLSNGHRGSFPGDKAAGA
jgi:hypothetical protein